MADTKRDKKVSAKPNSASLSSGSIAPADSPPNAAALAAVAELEALAVIELNVGGRDYATSLQLLRKYPQSMLASLFSGRFPLIKDSRNRYFIDRDGESFRYILNWLRDGFLPVRKTTASTGDWSYSTTVTLEGTILRDQLLNEAKYYGLDALVKQLGAVVDAASTAATLASNSVDPIVSYEVVQGSWQTFPVAVAKSLASGYEPHGGAGCVGQSANTTTPPTAAAAAPAAGGAAAAAAAAAASGPIYFQAMVKRKK